MKTGIGYCLGLTQSHQYCLLLLTDLVCRIHSQDAKDEYGNYEANDLAEASFFLFVGVGRTAVHGLKTILAIAKGIVIVHVVCSLPYVKIECMIIIHKT